MRILGRSNWFVTDFVRLVCGVRVISRRCFHQMRPKLDSKEW